MPTEANETKKIIERSRDNKENILMTYANKSIKVNLSPALFALWLALETKMKQILSILFTHIFIERISFFILLPSNALIFHFQSHSDVRRKLLRENIVVHSDSGRSSSKLYYKVVCRSGD